MKDNVCNNTDDTKRYYDLMRELQWDMTLPKFIEKTKCHLKSNFSQVNKMKYRSKLAVSCEIRKNFFSTDWR